MPQQLTVSVENNFTKGLITESTGLNFPENAATDTSNCLYTLVGDVSRRLGIKNEINYSGNILAARAAMNSYVWNNPGGDSSKRILVEQISDTLYFYDIAASSNTNPLSKNLLASTIYLPTYAVTTFDRSLECTFTDGNGYLFVFHPNCDPLFITYSAGTLSAASIPIRIRDFVGTTDGLQPTDRPSSLTAVHQYNLINQGWTSGNPWSATSSTSVVTGTGTKIFTIATGITGINPGDYVVVTNAALAFPGGAYQPAGSYIMGGTITSYTSGTGQLVTNMSSVSGIWSGSTYNNYIITPVNYGKISTWNTAVGNYPSNSDVWWYFKNASKVFDPATTIGNVTLNTGNSPRGHTILNAFNQDRSTVTGVAGLNVVSTLNRPTNGVWYQGRVWYAGVNDSISSTLTTDFYSWSSNIYFSQVVQSSKDFGNCYQTNDPTSENLLDILPTDGGVISIPEAGIVYKLFPIANGLIVFAANGVWFITGSQGIGFAANDYTITKLSSVRSISSTSFVNVMGLPYFWNEEGIYQVAPKQGGSLAVEPITVGTILSFFDEIPYASKVYVRGDYDPIEYIIKWTYRSTQEIGVQDRYNFDSILNYNVYNKAFFPYKVSTTSISNYINGIRYITYPSTSIDTPNPGIKYLSSHISNSSYSYQFAEEYDDSYLDWGSSDYTSYFVTGYKLRGQAIKKFQPQYIQMWYRTNNAPSSYTIQGIWDYASDPNSGKYTSVQQINTGNSRFATSFKRHKIRGRGYALQFKISSVTGKPFDIQGWAVVDTVNTGT